MSTENIKVKEPEGFQAFKLWLYNSETKEFLGRSGSSWAKIGIFYLIFYTILAIFWGLMLKLFMSTISYEKPKWILDDSLIGLNPGMGFRPTPPIEKIDTTLITFKRSSNESYGHWVKDLENFLKPYRNLYESKSECRRFPTRDEKCPFLLNLANHPCGPKFGYDTGSPCVLVKLNRIFNWKPNPYRRVDDLVKKLQDSKDPRFSTPKVKNSGEMASGEGLITLNCDGLNASDKEKLGEIEYWPKQGFPAEYYPYTNQKDYLSPFVLVKFNNPSKGVVINIECVAFDGKIKLNRYNHEGTLNFELMIDN